MHASSVEPGSPAAPPSPAKKRRSIAAQAVRWLGRQLRWSWPFLVLVLLFVVYTGWQRRSTGGEYGSGLAGPPQPSAVAQHRLRVAVYNIQGSVGKDDNDASLRTIARTLADVDIAGLVEVRANARRSDDRNQAQRIAEVTQRGWIFAPAEQRFWAHGGGNALLSRVAVGPWTRLPLPESNDAGSHRNVLLADVPLGGRTVRVMVTHLDRGRARERQLAVATHLFASIESPAILLADLNTTPGDALLTPLLSVPGATDVVATSSVKAGPERVDWIVIKGLRVVEVGRVDDPASSDHACFWADLELIP